MGDRRLLAAHAWHILTVALIVIGDAGRYLYYLDLYYLALCGVQAAADLRTDAARYHSGQCQAQLRRWEFSPTLLVSSPGAGSQISWAADGLPWR